jgi:uncharacterized membrane protein
MWTARRQAKALLLVAGLSALAALFGPAEPWGPLDVGATGAAVFTLCLVVAVMLFAIRGDAIFPEETSLAERRAWLGLVFVAIVLLSFMRHLWALRLGGEVPEGIDSLFAHRFIQRLILLIIVWSLLSHLLGRNAGVVEDERDLRMQGRADRAGDWVLTLIVIACVCVLASVPAANLAWWLSPIVLANALIGLLIAKTLAEYLALTLQYRAARA